MNSQGEDFGSERLETVIATHSLESAEQVVSSIFLAAGFHAGNLDPVDDQTVIAVRI
jgi:serine phosphatase RsbU (regulator of sigma subunit)